jgi:hypothetical protein
MAQKSPDYAAVESAEYTASGTGYTSSIPNNEGYTAKSVTAILKVAVRGGTVPTLDVKLEISEDGTTWANLANGAFTQQTSSTAVPNVLYLVQLPVAGKKIRANYTITGTLPTWEFSVEYAFLFN